MLKKILLILITQFTFSQSNHILLEDRIYNAVDVFTANPTLENLKILEFSEKSFYPKTKLEFLAIIYLYNNKAYYLNNLGQTQNAIKNYEKAWMIFQEKTPKISIQSYDIIETCLKPLGNLYTKIGDYENAENIIKEYFYIANVEKNNPEASAHKFSAVLNLSSVYYSSGKHLEAINLLEKTIKSERLTENQKGELYNNLGNNYFALNNNNKAITCYELSIKYLKNSNKTESLSNAYRNIALIKNDFKLFEKAKETFLKNKNNTPRSIAKLYYDEAFLNNQNNKLIETQVSLENVYKILIPSYSKSVLPKKNILYAETTLLDALDLQASIFIKQNQPKKALEAYQLCFFIEELFQSLLVYENSKIINQIANRNRTEKCISIYFSLFQKDKKTAHIENAFLLSEATKSTVLKDYKSNSKTFSREEKLIRQQLQDWNNTIIKEQQKGNYADITLINQAIKKQNELMLLLKSKEVKQENKVNNDLKINDLYSKLEKDNASMITYFYGEHEMYIFKLEKNTIKLESFKIDEISNTKITRFLDFFTSSEKIIDNVSEYNHTGFLIHEMLKIPKRSNYKNLIIIPDGLLNFLPFEALITKESTTTNFAKMNYLVTKFKICYNNSASFYLSFNKLDETSKFEKETVLGVFPVFENSNLELAFSKKEMEAIEKNFKGKYLSKNEATFENFKTNAVNFSILHLSTHANSGDIYEPSSIKFYDKEIFYSELYNLDISPNLVVLSACETGIGKLYKAEGAMSIARGFQFAGAQNLLLSLWKVNDYTTSVLMQKFYYHLKQKETYFNANHQAKLDFLKNSSLSNAKKSPYYWSAFVYYGTLENQESNNYFIWISIFVGIISILFFWKLFRKGSQRRHQESQRKK